MSKRVTRSSTRTKRPKAKLGLPDLDHSKAAVLDSLRSPESKRGIDEFIQWCCEPRLPMPEWVKETVDSWTGAAELSGGKLFRCVCRAGMRWVTALPGEWSFMRQVLPFRRRRAGADSIPPRARFRADH